MNKDCVINPKTGRAVKISSVAGKKVMKTDPTPTHDCVINPKTGRAVKKTGAVGKKIVNASSTITQAVKMKIARKTVEKAKAEAKLKTPPPAPKEPKAKPPKDSKVDEMNEDEAYKLIDKYVEILSLQKRIRSKGKQQNLFDETYVSLSFMSDEKQRQYLKKIEKAVAKWEKDNEGNYLRWDLGKDLKYWNNFDFMYDVFSKAMELEPDKRLTYFRNIKGVDLVESFILMKRLEHLSGKKLGGEIDKYFIR